MMSRMQFRFDCPDAQAVFAVGAFNGWSTTATPLTRSASGRWEACVDMPRGHDRHVYFVLFDPAQNRLGEGMKFRGVIIDPAQRPTCRAAVTSL
jgi:1,4-alpha-glucan branching enzyme